VESPTLDIRGLRQHVELGWRRTCRAHSVLGERREIGKQTLEAVDGDVLIRPFCRVLPLRARRAHRWRDDGRSFSLPRGLVVVVEENRLELLAHVPLDVVGKHAKEHVSTYPIVESVKD